MAWYRTGTASVANGSAAVTGALTGWSSQAKAGDRITFDGGGKWYEILSVTDNTHLTLGSNFAETTVSGGAYAIDRSGPQWNLVSELAASVAALLAIFPALGGVGDALKVFRANAAGTAAELSDDYVTGAANITDNHLVRGDGGALGVQQTGISVSDADDVSGVHSLAMPTIPFSGVDAPINLSLVASVSGNALTIAVKGADGNDPSATNPVYVPFRSATATAGAPVWRAITSALSFVVSSGSTLGTVANVPFRVWVELFDDAGTLRLGVIQRITGGATPTAMAVVADHLLASSTAEGGAGAADSAGTFYTNTAVTTKPYRILGYLSWSSGLATPGTWSSGPTTIQLFGPGVPRPGDVIRSVIGSTSTPTQTTSTSFVSTLLTAAIALTSAVNLTRITACVTLFAQDGGNPGWGQIHNNGGTGIGPIASVYTSAAAQTVTMAACVAFDAPGTVSNYTYTWKIKEQAGGGSSGVSSPATASYPAFMYIEEIMA